MNKEQFESFWTFKYPNSIPISHTFKHDYPERWFRIHSLPGSKRYPTNAVDWKVLLDRQNTIITDILGDNSKIIIITGDYHLEGYSELHPIGNVDSIKRFSFISLAYIDLYKINSEEYDQGQVYRPIFCKEVWTKSKFDDLLRDIAEDNLRAFFVSIGKDIIVAPYDGGIDFILKDSWERNEFKSKYNDWLSTRDDGL